MTAPVLVPAGAGAGLPPPAAGPPLFVVDPAGDLPGGAQLVPFYRESFPGAWKAPIRSHFSAT